MRLSSVGAMKVDEQRKRAINASACSGSNFCMTTTVLPSRWA